MLDLFSKNKRASAIAVGLVGAAIFFATAFSSFQDLIKGIVIIADLFLSGTVISKLLSIDSFFGIIMIRSQSGLNQMIQLGRNHPKLFRHLSDFGLSVCLGIPYSFYILWRSGRKVEWLVHSILVVAFYYWLTSMTTILPGVSQWVIFTISLILGLAGLGLASLFTSALSILVSSTAQSSVEPVVPGITLPLVQGIIALVIVAAVHELAHGVLCSVEKVKVKSSGAILLGFLPIGAFVEPDENALEKSGIWAKRRVLIAGSASNFYFFLILLPVVFAIAFALPLMSNGLSVSSVPINGPGVGLFSPGQSIVAINGVNVTVNTDVNGLIANSSTISVQTQSTTIKANSSYVVVESIDPASPASKVLEIGDRILAIGSTQVDSLDQLQSAIAAEPIDATFKIDTQRGSFDISRGSDGHIGVSVEQVPAIVASLEPKPGLSLLFEILEFLYTTIGLAAILNLAVALINVLPLFITDGHRLLFEELTEVLGPKQRRKAAFLALVSGLVILSLLAINLGRWFKLF